MPCIRRASYDASCDGISVTPRQVLFVHGGGEGTFEAYSKLVASLREKLGPGYIVRYPTMPDEANPDYQIWKKTISLELTVMGDDAILVGHSIGASVVIKLLADGDVNKSVNAVFLIATPFWHDHEVWKWKEVELPKDVSVRLPNEVPVFLYHGRADELVPFSHAEMYATTLPRSARPCTL